MNKLLPEPNNLPDNPKLSVCMIVRDEEKNLPRCLKSLIPIADELVIVDTGSNDDTVSVARDFGAKVFSFKWCDDFSAARNESLKHAHGDWILQLDADEELLPTSVPYLKTKMQHPTLLYCVIQCDNGPNCCGMRFNWFGRLFRNHPKIEYKRPYHEGIDSSVETLIEIDSLWSVEYDSTIVVRHHGYTKSRMEVRSERGIPIMELYLKDNPDDSYILSQLGTVYSTIGKYEKAEDYLRRAIKLNPESPETNYSLGVSLQNLNKTDAAIKYYKNALSKNSNLAEACGNIGAIYLNKGMVSEAIAELKKALQINPDLVQGHNNMGIALSYQSDLKSAVYHFTMALNLLPDYAEAHSNLGSALARQGEFKEAVYHYQEALRIKPDFLETKHYLRLALKEMGEKTAK